MQIKALTLPISPFETVWNYVIKYGKSIPEDDGRLLWRFDCNLCKNESFERDIYIQAVSAKVRYIEIIYLNMVRSSAVQREGWMVPVWLETDIDYSFYIEFIAYVQKALMGLCK